MFLLPLITRLMFSSTCRTLRTVTCSSATTLVVPAHDKINLEIISNKNGTSRETASYTILARNADGNPVPGAESV